MVVPNQHSRQTQCEINLAVVPAAGRGTRLMPATRSQPKEMLPVGRKPVIQYVIEELSMARLQEVLLISGQGKRAIEDHLDRDIVTSGEEHESWMDMHLFHARQSSPRGLADAISIAEPFVGNRPFVVALGDSIVRSNSHPHLLERMIRAHQVHRPVATIAVETVPHEAVNRYGIVAPIGDPGDEFMISDIVEKPTQKEAPSNLSVAARYILEPDIFDAIRRTKPGKGGELQLTDALRILLQDGKQILCVHLIESEYRLDIGNFKSYFQAFADLAMDDIEHGETFKKWLRKRLGT